MVVVVDWPVQPTLEEPEAHRVVVVVVAALVLETQHLAVLAGQEVLG